SALLSYIVTLVKFTLASLPSPPRPGAEFPLSVTRFRVARLEVLPFMLKMPPPKHEVPAQVLSLTVTSVSDRISLFAIPPPGPLVFCVTTTLLRFNVTTLLPAAPPVWMPPPDASMQVWPCGQPAAATQICVLVVEQVPPGFPLRIVTPEMVVAPLANTSNTRSIPFPSMITLLAPAPVMLT